MPPTSIRDLVIKDDDLAVATHGRGFWILDDITPLRQLTGESTKQRVFLYKPQTATRIRWSMYPDTPVPQEEPAGENPPDGAIIDYFLADAASGTVTLEITDQKGNLIRSYSSRDTLYKIPDLNIPLYWIRPQQLLSGEKGHHRYLWDMKYAPLNTAPSYPISAIYKNTAPNPTSPWVMPGQYNVKLTVDGKTQAQTFSVRMDPRVKTPAQDLLSQHDHSLYAYNSIIKTRQALEVIAQIKIQVKSLKPIAEKESVPMLDKLEQQLAALENSASGVYAPGLVKMENDFATLFAVLQENDHPPTSQAIKAANTLKKDFSRLESAWLKFKENNIPELNRMLEAHGLAPLK
jgi:hypothetical protein